MGVAHWVPRSEFARNAESNWRELETPCAWWRARDQIMEAMGARKSRPNYPSFWLYGVHAVYAAAWPDCPRLHGEDWLKDYDTVVVVRVPPYHEPPSYEPPPREPPR
jgi:hypothetical protein